MLPATISRSQGCATRSSAMRASTRARGSTDVSADDRGTGSRHQRAQTPVARCWGCVRACRCDFHHAGPGAGGFIIAGGVYSPMDGFVDSAPRPDHRPTVGLVLTGGGARSAYQVGVLLALAELLPRARNPFQIIVGTSAGAVAAGVLAAEAHHWRRAVAGLERVWANFRSSQVFHVDARHMLRAGAHWVLALISGGLVLSPPKSMLDNTPLRELLGVHVDCAGTCGRSRCAPPATTPAARSPSTTASTPSATGHGCSASGAAPS